MKLASAFPLMVRMLESNIFSVRLSVHPSPVNLFVAVFLQNHWAEFNQTCYTTSPHGKVVREQLYMYFSMHPSSVHLSITCLLLNHWAEVNQTCYITSPHGKGVREQHYVFVRPSVHHAISS